MLERLRPVVPGDRINDRLRSRAERVYVQHPLVIRDRLEGRIPVCSDAKMSVGHRYQLVCVRTDLYEQCNGVSPYLVDCFRSNSSA